MNAMLSYNKDVLRDLLWLINFGECELAVLIWSDFRKDIMKGCATCPGVKSRTDLICGKCLELTLRRYEALAPEDVEMENEHLLATRNLVNHYGRGQLM
ncbi:MAG: hypothetical protein JKY27_08605 [Magnetovibrio sp.]|nr:hypothetical protein [Magnetovibrio sp.]